MKTPWKTTWPTKAAAIARSNACTKSTIPYQPAVFQDLGWYAKWGQTARVSCWPSRCTSRSARVGMLHVLQLATKPLVPKSSEPVGWTVQVLHLLHLLRHDRYLWGTDTPIPCHTSLSGQFADLCDCCCSRCIEIPPSEKFELARAAVRCHPTGSSRNSSQSEAASLRGSQFQLRCQWTSKGWNSKGFSVRFSRRKIQAPSSRTTSRSA